MTGLARSCLESLAGAAEASLGRQQGKRFFFEKTTKSLLFPGARVAETSATAGLVVFAAFFEKQAFLPQSRRHVEPVMLKLT